MIEQLPFVLELSEEQAEIIDSKHPWQGSYWTDDDFEEHVKPTIREQLEDNQDTCAYCGLPFKGAKDKQIEHVAPKAQFRHPWFTFTLKNLVLSCGYCNDLIVKGAKETIELPACTEYDHCRFLLVHPYLDDPDQHYDWVEDEDNDQVLIQVKGGSEKGMFSIQMFDLASQGMSELRACEAFRKRKHSTEPIAAPDEEVLQLTLNFKE